MNACPPEMRPWVGFSLPNGKKRKRRKQHYKHGQSHVVRGQWAEVSAEEEIFAFNLVEIIVIHMIVYYATFNDLTHDRTHGINYRVKETRYTRAYPACHLYIIHSQAKGAGASFGMWQEKLLYFWGCPVSGLRTLGMFALRCSSCMVMLACCFLHWLYSSET